MNLLVVYLWSAWGLQLFGGQLYEDNPKLKEADLDYFSSHFQVYNFNDMVLGMVTMFLVTITNWVDPIAAACLVLSDDYSFNWFLAGIFWLTFYVGSPLIAFNVWTAFSIDVFCKLQVMEPERTEIYQNLGQIQAEMADKRGLCLHIHESAELAREMVYKALFEEDT